MPRLSRRCSDRRFCFAGPDADAPCCCTLLLLPVWLGVQAGFLPAHFDGGKLLVWRWSQLISDVPQLRTKLLVGALTQWAQSVCAYMFIEHVSPATSVVVGTARKPFIVVVSVAVFARPINLLNVFGIILACESAGPQNPDRIACSMSMCPR